MGMIDLSDGVIGVSDSGSAGASPLDLSAGIVDQPKTKSIDLSAGMVDRSSPIDLSAGIVGQPSPTAHAWTPSVWDRIKSVVLSGVPNYSSRTPSDPNYGQTQLLSPAEALTPSEQREHPIITGIGEVAGGLTSPKSVALIAGTGGLGELSGAAAMIPRLLSAGFGAQSIYQAARTYPSIRAAIARGDTPEVERLLTHAVLDLGMGALAARHAATGKGAVSGKERSEADSVEMRPAVETRTVEPTSPVGELLHEHPPDVRIADTTAVKDHLVDQDTIHPEGQVVAEKNREAEATTEAADANPEQDRSAAVGSPPDIAPLRTARTVADAHVPVVSQSEVLAEAVQSMFNNSRELEKLDLDPSQVHTVADAEAMLQKAADHIDQNLDPRASAVIGFDAQKQLASELGMTVEDLLSRKSGQAFNAEAAIASRALLHDSGMNVIKAAQQAVADPNTMSTFTDSLAQHQRVLDAVTGMSAEAGRALGSFNVQDLPASKIADVMSKLSPEAKLKAAQLLTKIDPQNPRQLNDFIEKITSNSTADKIFEFYRNSLLSGPATVIKKGASEATMLALEATKKLAAAGISKIKGGEDQRYASESYWFAKGAIDALQHSKAVLSGEFNLEDAPGFEKTGQQAIKGPLGTIVRFPSTVLSRQTNLMYVLNFFGELNAQAARKAISEGLSGRELAGRQEYLVQHPTAEMTDAAHDTGLHNTFQTELGKFGKKVQGAIRSDPTGAMKYLIPFFKTPINLAKEASYYSPYGLLKGSLKGDVDMQARGIVGSSIAAGIAYLAANNLVTGGGPVDIKKRDTLEATGWQPYSVKIGDRYYSYRRLEPVGLAMGLVADAVHGMKVGDSEQVTNSKVDTAINHIVRSLQDVAFVPTLSNLSEMITNPGARAQNFIARQVSGFIPAAVKDVAQTVDPTIRKPTGVTQTLESRIPGLTNRVPAVIDVAGKPVQRSASAVGGANPFPVSTAKNDPVLTELARLGISTSQAPATFKKKGRPTQLTPAQRQQLTQQEGQDLYKTLSRIVDGKAWQSLTDDQRRKQITRFRRQIESQRPARIAQMK
jgi:hypothetical protein